MPSMTSASAPPRTSFFADRERWARSRPPWPRPPSAAAWPRAAAGRRPARHARPAASRQTSTSSSSSGCMTIRLTPNGRSVSARGGRDLLAPAASGLIAPQASTPKPPASLIAATRMALGHPGHRPAQDGELACRGTRGRAATGGERGRAAAAVGRHAVSPGRARRRCAARAAPARCTPRRSAR